MNPYHRILPLYFRQPDRPLFGCYHQPFSNRRPRCGVVICQPVGHEYINSHRALRQLAARFAEVGFPVLRFDYYGCGDSSGDIEDASISNWLEDISSAIGELKHRSGLSVVCLVGLRLGASLALLASALRNDVSSLVLWDPVEKGGDYRAELLRLRKDMMRFRPKTSRQVGDSMDIAGFRFSPRLMAELEDLNLLEGAAPPVKNVLIVKSDGTREDGCLRHHLSASTAHVDWKHLQAPSIWQPNAEGSLLVPSQLLQAVVSWSCGVCS